LLFDRFETGDDSENVGEFMRRAVAKTLALLWIAVGFTASGLPSAGQTTGESATAQDQSSQLEVNWLYGAAFVPKDVPPVQLTPKRRALLNLRQTYLTYGIYLKTAFLSFGDQATRSPPERGDAHRQKN
jgi:hypothetical protein